MKATMASMAGAEGRGLATGVVAALCCACGGPGGCARWNPDFPLATEQWPSDTEILLFHPFFGKCSAQLQVVSVPTVAGNPLENTRNAPHHSCSTGGGGGGLR